MAGGKGRGGARNRVVHRKSDQLRRTEPPQSSLRARRKIARTPIPNPPLSASNRRASLRSASSCKKTRYAEESTSSLSSRDEESQDESSSSHLNTNADNLFESNPNGNASLAASPHASLRYSRCRRMQLMQQFASPIGSSSGGRSSRANYANAIQPLGENTQLAASPPASMRVARRCIKIPCMEQSAPPLGSSTQETSSDDSLPLQINVDYGTLYQSVIPQAPLTSTSKTAKDCDNTEALSSAVPEETVAPPSSIPTPAAHDITAIEQVQEGDDNIGNERHERYPRVSQLGGSLSVNLTEMLSMWQDDGEDEVLSSSLVTVHGYHVKEASAGILESIIDKYGDIASSCTLTTVDNRSCFLDMICGIVQSLKEKHCKDITRENVRNWLDVVADLKEVNMRVDWLYERLNDILEVKKTLQRCGTLKEEKSRLTQEIDETRRQLKEDHAKILTLQERIMLNEEKLTYAEAEIDNVLKAAEEARSKVMIYYGGSMDKGLL